MTGRILTSDESRLLNGLRANIENGWGGETLDAAEVKTIISIIDRVAHSLTRNEIIEQCAVAVEEYAAGRKAKEAERGFGPATAAPVANMFWCEEAADVLRALKVTKA